MEIRKPEMTEATKARLNELYLMLRRRTHTKSEIMAHFGVSERTAREMISLVSKRAPVIATSDNSGYRIARTAEDLEAVLHSLNELESRRRELDERKQPLIKFYEKAGAINGRQ